HRRSRGPGPARRHRADCRQGARGLSGNRRHPACLQRSCRCGNGITRLRRRGRMMRLSEAALATHGRVVGRDVVFSAVGTDSRAVQPEELFVALRGERFDGHDYVGQCLQQGAVAAMVESAPEGLAAGVVVADTKLALGQLAAYWRRKFAIPLAAVTGSNGKTTVKEMLAGILRAATDDDAAVLATQGNLNNDIGMPLTLL